MSELLVKLLPLYVFVLLGALAARLLGVRKESVAPLLIYIIQPLVTFRAVTTVPLDAARLLLPCIVFGLCCAFCLLAERAARPFGSPARQILGFGAGNANSGYFGLPLAVALLGEAAFAQAAMLSFGFVLYENTVGFYVAARGRSTTREALLKVLALPTLYACIGGVALRAAHVPVPEPLVAVLLSVRETYTVLGMMLLGLALGDLRRLAFDAKFVAFALSAKFLLWPLTALAIVALDAATLRVFDALARDGLLLASLLPMAANTVAIATLNEAEPEKVSVAVLLSTLLAVLLIPLVFPLLAAAT